VDSPAGVSRRAIGFALAIVSFALVGYALYAQAYQGFNPCPLCIFQRIGLTALGVALLLAALPPSRLLLLRRCGAVGVGVVAAATVGIAIRHLYIQHLPDGMVPVCGASLDYMLEVFPLTDVLRKVLTGSGECHKVDWTFLGLAMPAWVLIWSLVLGTVGFWNHWRRDAR
jgi:protein dithiol:quinone oxidoreductase